MIVKNWAFVAAAFVLLQLTPLKCDAQKHHPQCEGEICHIYPDNFWQLQNIISSNRHIILNGVEFNVNGSNGFTVIENVSNLTISSAEEEGSIIKCSLESTFGLHLKNSTNISLTGITIINCASCIPNHTIPYQHLSHIYNEATFLIMTSRNVNLLKVYIGYSLGVALAIYDSVLEEPQDNMNYNLTLTNCTITHSREGSIVIFGTSLLIEKTLITNCSRGIDNYKANLMMKNVLFSNCTYNSSLAGGHAVVTERLQMANSSITISESNIIFIGDKSNSGLVVIQSNIYVSKNSVLQFQKFNDTCLNLSQSTLILNNDSTMTFTQNNVSTTVIAFFLQSNMSVSNGSTLSITDNTLTEETLMFQMFNDTSLNLCQSTLTLNTNSTMTFTQNNASTAVMVCFLQSYVSVSNGSTLSISDNTLTEGTLMLWYNSFINVNDGILLLEENKCQYSDLIRAINTSITLENRSVFNLTNNTIHIDSSIIYHSEGWMSFSESSLVASNNSVAINSKGLHYGNSSLMLRAAKLQFEDNKCHDITCLILAINATIRMEKLSLFNFSHNEVHKYADILYIVGAHFIAHESSVVTTNNSVTYHSHSLYLLNSTFILSKGNLLLEENKCRNSELIRAINTNMILENRSIFNFTHNTIYIHSSIFYKSEGWMSFSESSLVASNNSVAINSKGLHYGNSSLMLRVAKLQFKDNKCHFFTCLIVAINATIRMEKLSLVNFSHNEMQHYADILYIVGAHFIAHESSVVTTNNSVTYHSHSLYLLNSTFILSKGNLLLEENKCQYSELILSINTNITLENRSVFNFTHNTIHTDSSIFYHSERWMSFSESSLVASNNSVAINSEGLHYGNSSLMLRAAKLQFEDNKCHDITHLILTINATIVMENESFFNFLYNDMDDSAIFLVSDSIWNMSSGSELQMFNNTGSGFFTSTNASFSGTVSLLSNTAIFDGGVFNTVFSALWFKGTLEVMGNRGEVSGGFFVVNSDMYITGTALFADNNAANGGAISFISSVMHISPNATVNFTNNYAEHLGGAIYISEPRTSLFLIASSTAFSCSIQVLPENFSDRCQTFSLTFNQNKAGTAGNAIYGGRTSACSQCGKNTEYICDDCSIPDGSDLFHYNGMNDSSDLSNFTSDPTRVCFCEKGIPNCYKVLNNITVYPGENFNLSLAIIGFGLGTVPGLVIARNNSKTEGSIQQGLFGSEREYSQEIRGITCQDAGYSIVSEREREYFALAVVEQSFLKSLEVSQSVVNFILTRREGNEYYASLLFSSIYDDFFYIPVFVKVNFLACPVGFQLVRGRCVCHKILLNNNINTCFISNGTGLILRPVPYWIGLPNDTNSPILIHPHCPFDYCQSKDINITAESPNTQCQYQRSGVLCGSCREGLSMILGSSECKDCSNVYLVSITFFILCGVALVTILTLLNMTVSVGTLNGLILLANFLQANRTAFLPATLSNTRALITFLDVFIAWLNLDLGIPMCFFDGLTTYVKTWLQFLFPLYILTLVGVMIITSNYSTRMTRLFGTNAVSVLATLVLLSYTKILRILITVFSFTTLTRSQGYHSVVWLANGNIKYFEPKHAILFLVALLVLLLLGVPYTVTLIAAPWIQRSRFRWVSSLYNRFKPLFDAYMGPYKNKHRYWTGMLLLVRVVLIVLFSSIANTNTVAGPQLNLLLLSLSSFILFGLTAALKPYKKKLLNGLEIFFLIILFIFSSSNLYISNIGTRIGVCVYMYIFLVGICFLVFLGICVHHIWYRLRKIQTMRRSQQLNRKEAEKYHPPLWQRAKGRAKNDDKEREEIKMSQFEATNTISHGERRESLVKLLADLPE